VNLVQVLVFFRLTSLSLTKLTAVTSAVPTALVITGVFHFSVGRLIYSFTFSR